MTEYGDVENIVLRAVRQWFAEHREEFPDIDGGDVLSLSWYVMSALTSQSTLPIKLSVGTHERSGQLSDWAPDLVG